MEETSTRDTESSISEAESELTYSSSMLDRLNFTPLEETSEIWQQKIVHRLKEAIAQTYLQIDGSQETHREVYQMIRTYANNHKNRFPSIETYRGFRFCMYMEIMNDAQSGHDKAVVFRKWRRMCDYDMEPCEKDFIRCGF